MIELSSKHIDAIRSAVEDTGGKQADFAAKVGLAPSYISRYLNGETTRISAMTWRVLSPHIERYLVPDEKELVERARNLLTVPLVKIFEQLNKKNARAVFAYAEDLLEEQNNQPNAGGL